jgi:spermidine synthase
MAGPYTYTPWQWVLSFFKDVPIARVQSDKNPPLEVSLERGRLRLHAGDANYSYGTLQTVFADVFTEFEIGKHPINSALVLGLGAGGVARLIRKTHPHCAITGVEWDPVVVTIARHYFALQPHANLNIVQGDAVNYLLQYQGPPFDLIVVDLFYEHLVPPAAETDAFLLALDRNLAPGGLLLYNRVVQFVDGLQNTDAFRPRFERQFPDFGWYNTLGNEVWIHYKDEPA